MTIPNSSDLILALIVLALFSIFLSILSMGVGDAMTMLKPKRPKVRKDGTDICPFCERILERDYNYCPKCGQMLSWDRKDDVPHFKDVIEALKKKGDK